MFHLLVYLVSFSKRLSCLVLLGLFLWQPNPAKSQVVSVARFPDPTLQSIGDIAERRVIQRFNELYPHIQLRKAGGLGIQGGSNTMDMVPLMRIAADVSPAVLYVNFRMSDTYIRRGFLQPLDGFMSKSQIAELPRRVPPAVQDVAYREGPDGQKHWYMLPTSRHVRVLMYRRDLFARAGLDANKPPRTWSEFYYYAKKLSDPAKNHYGMVFIKGDVSSWDFANLVWSRGGDIVVKNKSGEWEPSFNTPQVVDALYFYIEMTKKLWKGRDKKLYRGVAFRDVDPDIVLQGDSYAMTFGYLVDKLNVHQPELIGYAPVPSPDHYGKSASEVNCVMVGIFAGIKDKRTAKAAFDYIWFLDSNEANHIRVKTYIQYGYGRFVNPELLERFGYTDYLKQVDRKWVKVYKDALVVGKPEPYGENCSVIYRELSRPIEQALSDRKVLSALDRGDKRAVKKRLKIILDRAQAETASRMYGTLQKDVKRLRYSLTFIFLVVALAVFSIALGYLMRTFRREAPAQTPGQRKALLAYVFLVPAVISVIVWQYLPLLRGTVMAFQDYNIMGKSPFIGLNNFSSVLFDPNFWHSIWVTILYTALYMGFAFVSPIFVALLLAEIPRGKILFRTIFYLPAMLSGLVVIFLWKSFYKPGGLLNILLGHIGVHIGTSWLDVPTLAMVAVLLPVIWAGMGPGSLIYLAALKTIPEEFYEAAEVDGAGIFRKIISITLPGLKMLILINAVGAFIGASMSSETIFAMTGGGPYTPYGATEVVGLQLFYTAFVYLKFGLANAMAWVLGFMLIGFTMLQLKNLSRVEFKGGR